MTTSLGVYAGESARRSGDIDVVIASLPVTLRPSTAATELVGIAGETGWAGDALAAIEGGAIGLIIIDPVAEDAADLSLAAERRGVPVVIDYPFAGNPAMPMAAAYFSASESPHALLECTVTTRPGGNLRRLIMDQFALVRALDGQIETATALDWTDRRYVVTARTEQGRRVRLTAISTTAQPPAAAVRMLGADGSVEFNVPDPGTARPAVATLITPSGAESLPTLFETAHRLTWRRLARLVHDGGQASDLSRFTKDSSIVGALTGASLGR